jgi:tripartite ATP-independent transporter DctM subunit
MTFGIVVLFVIFFAIAALGFPIGVAMLAAGVAYLFATGQDIGLCVGQVMNGMQGNYVLLAIPLFIFAANLMNAGTISDRLLEFSRTIVGRLPGGLAHVNILTSVIFSGMSGSAVADAAGPGMVMVRMMTKGNRYSPGLAGAVTAASATIGPIIPPSIPMVLYAMVSDTSVGALFLGGVIPGLLMAVILMLYVAVQATWRKLPREAPTPISAIPTIIFKGSLPLLMPVILLGGIYSGITTATEAAAVAALYALLVSVVVYRSIGFEEFISVVKNSVKGSAVIAIAIAGAFIFNYAIANEKLPQALASFLDDLNLAPLVFLFTINAIFLFLGCFLDVAVMLLVMVPLIIPSVAAIGLDLVHFGVVIVVNIMIGLATPPYGMLLFVINRTAQVDLSDLISEMWVFVVLLIGGLALMICVPDIVLWLPKLFDYSG